MEIYDSFYPSICLSIHILSLSLFLYINRYIYTYLPSSFFIHLSVCLPGYLFTHLFIHPSHPSIYLSIYLSVCLSVCLSTCLSVHASFYPFIHPSVHLAIFPPIFPFVLSFHQPIYRDTGIQFYYCYYLRKWPRNRSEIAMNRRVQWNQTGPDFSSFEPGSLSDPPSGLPAPVPAGVLEPAAKGVLETPRRQPSKTPSTRTASYKDESEG